MITVCSAKMHTRCLAPACKMFSARTAVRKVISGLNVQTMPRQMMHCGTKRKSEAGIDDENVCSLDLKDGIFTASNSIKGEYHKSDSMKQECIKDQIMKNETEEENDVSVDSQDSKDATFTAYNYIKDEYHRSDSMKQECIEDATED